MILRYIRGTSYVALYYEGSEVVVKVYVNSDFRRDLDKMKSTTECVNTYRRSYKLGFKPVGCCGFIYNKSNIHGNYISLQENYLNTEVIGGARAQIRKIFCIL